METGFLSVEILLLCSLLLSTISYADINLGSTLEPTSNQNNNTWRSPEGSFSLQFIPVSSSFSVAITFTGIPIWKAGGESGVVDSNSRFEFLNNGNLRLINGSGTIIWQSNTPNRGITVATLDNSGNLSLKNGTTTVWSTFENPTDTIVPSQVFTSRNTLRSGIYSFALIPPGNLTLRWNNEVIYWNRGNSSDHSSLFYPSLRLLSTGIVEVNDLISVYSSDYSSEDSNIFRFIKLDSDGNLRIYSFDRSSGNLTERWAAVSDQCEVYGFCGNMGICSYKGDSNTICGCPSENFEFMDPNDPRKGCKRKVEIEDCPGNATMLQLDNTQFFTYAPELSSQRFYISMSECSSNCFNSGPCKASTALSDGSGFCYLKTSSFVSGYQSPALPSISYVKVCRPGIPNRRPYSLNGSPIRTYKLQSWALVMVVINLVVLVLLGGWLWFWCCRNSSKRVLSAQYTLLEYASGAPVQFSYKDLQLSTKGFREKLGAGGFGAVYKGVLANRTVVAVKQLEGIEQGEKQFRMEVATISSTHHLNLVRLIGFCSEGRHRLLVYEFMKNGSLDSSLFTEEGTARKLLNWESRFNIALGTARGMTYLHEECRDCIIHCDIKPENILLDENYNAKVSDFGLAKLINPNDHRYVTLTSVRGTRGYLAPEWLANLPTTSKSDVYSYGMVLLEIVSGKRNFEVSGGTDRKKFSMWAYEEFERGNIYNILDKRLSEHEVDMEQVMRAILVSFWCIQEQPTQRPKMGKVVQMLEGITTIEKPPAPNVMAFESGMSTNVSAHSIIATSAPPPSSCSSSSFHVSRVDNNNERSPGPLLRSTYQ